MSDSSASDAGAVPVEALTAPSKPLGYRACKRCFDIAFSAVAIALGFLPGLVLAALVTLDTGGSPLYLQERVGMRGKTFRIVKFRTMVADADDVEKYLDENQLSQWGRERKVDGDPRITSLGRLLRQSSVDELPNFLNVLVGQMSVVGPRPVVSDELGNYGTDVAKLLSVRPGVTGWWQVTARNGAEYDGTRQSMELWYVNNASASLDMRIVARTASAVFKGTGM